MHKTILRMLWPYLVRYLANYAADYLEQRRQQRLHPVTAGGAATADCPPCPPCPPLPDHKAVSPGNNIVWFSLSGLLLGGAFGLIGYIFIRDRHATGHENL